MSFQISDKVVCVDASGALAASLLKEGTIYVVRSIAVHPRKPFIGLRVVGVELYYEPMIQAEQAWKTMRFRKLSDIKAENAKTAEQHAKLDAANFPST